MTGAMDEVSMDEVSMDEVSIDEVSMDVTGWAWRTPLGNSVDAALDRLLAGEHAFLPNPHAGAAGYACTLAATIAGAPARSRDARFVGRMGLHAMDVAGEAMAMSACKARHQRLGLFAAMGGLHLDWNDVMHAFSGQNDHSQDIWANGFRSLHPFILLKYLSNNAHALIAARLDARGEGVTFAGANAGAQALSAANAALAAETIDAALVVAYDSLVHPELLVEMADRDALTRARPGCVIAPYQDDSAGFVPGEAACAVVLERRGSAALARVSAADSCDGQAGAPVAGTVARAIARVARGDEIAVDGAALAHTEFDAAERHALAEILAPANRHAAPALCAVQASMGQLGAATQLAQTIALAACLRRGVLPPIAGLDAPAPGPLQPLTRAMPTRGKSMLGANAGAPGLAGAIRVAVT